MSGKKNYTIKDIAKLANVSPGTVDRVIHNRGRVSEKSMAKVSVVLDEIEYKPNVFAQSLKKQRSLVFIVLMPESIGDGYWNSAMKGISKSIEDFNHYGLEIEVRTFNGKDPGDFIEKADQCISEKPDGILITPVFLQEAREVLGRIEEGNIPYVTFNSSIPGLNPRCIIGQDLRQSGRLAANLIDLCNQNKIENLLVIHVDENPANAPHMIEKEKGFREYFQSKYPESEIRRIILPHRDAEKINNILNRETGGLRNVSGAFITTAKVHLVSYPIKSRFRNSIVVGYDLTVQNIDGIKSGTIDFLINQNPFMAAYEGISKLTDLLLLDKKIEKVKFLPLDIITRENLSSYN